MVDISNVLQLTVNIAATGVRVENFGTPAIVAYVPGVTGMGEYPLTVAGLTSLVTAGAGVTSGAYLMASAMAAQTPCASTVKLFGRRSTELNMYTFTPAAPRTGDAYSFQIEGTTVTYTALEGDTVADVCDGLVAAASLVTGCTVADGTTLVSVTADEIGQRLRIRSRTANLICADTSVPVGEVAGYGSTITLTPGTGGAIADGVYTLTIYDGAGTAHTASYTASGGTGTATLCVTDWITDLGTVPGVTIGGTTALTLAPTTAGDVVCVSAVASTGTAIAVTPSTYTVGRTIAHDLADAVLVDRDFFGFAIDSSESDTVQAAAVWAEANKRIFAGISYEDACADPVSTTDVCYALDASGYHFTFLLVTRDCGGYGNCALLSTQLAKDPGSSTWFGKSLSGPQVDTWTDAEYAAVKGKHGLVYTYLGDTGESMTFDGWAVSGRFLDLTHGTEWFAAQIRAQCAQAFLANDRIPFTQGGLDYLGSKLYSVCNLAVDQGLLVGGPPAPDGEGFVVVIPDIADATANDRANRFATGFGISGTFQGAIHSMAVEVALTTGG